MCACLNIMININNVYATFETIFIYASVCLCILVCITFMYYRITNAIYIIVFKFCALILYNIIKNKVKTTKKI